MTGYHSDVSYEHQPSVITILTLLAMPATGGDTGWTSQVAVYARLSEPIKALLEGLRAEHSDFPQADDARIDGKHVRRELVKSDHPIVRTYPVSIPNRNYHPHLNMLIASKQVTGQKALFIDLALTKRIVGLQDEESEAILKLLFTVSNCRGTLTRICH